DTIKIQPQVRKDHLGCISPRRHRDARAGVTAGAAQVNIADGGLVFAELGNWTQRAVLIREKRALSEGAVNGTGDLARDVDWGMGYAFNNFCLQVRNVIGGNEINEIISVRFARLGPSACRNFASRVAGNNPGDAQDDEFHQRFSGRSATGVYVGIVPTHDHRRRGQSAAATLEIDSCEEVEGRFGKMNMRRLAGSRSGFVVDRAV